MDLVTIIGTLAAICTTASYLPQVKKVWVTRSTRDISLKMFLLLAAGLALWVAYGVLQEDMMIIIANCLSLLMLSVILFFKLRGL
jgi:MtN3 and saliva related transmembrane protein